MTKIGVPRRFRPAISIAFLSRNPNPRSKILKSCGKTSQTSISTNYVFYFVIRPGGYIYIYIYIYYLHSKHILLELPKAMPYIYAIYFRHIYIYMTEIYGINIWPHIFRPYISVIYIFTYIYDGNIWHKYMAANVANLRGL